MENIDIGNVSKGYDRMVRNECLHKSRHKICPRSDNSFAVTKQGLFIQIEQFLVDEDNETDYTAYRVIDVDDCF